MAAFKRTLWILPPLLVLLSAPALAQDHVFATISATYSTDPGFEGLYRYDVSLQWSVSGPDRQPLVFYVDTRAFRPDCDLENDIVFAEPVGIVPGLEPRSAPCDAPYAGHYHCFNDRTLPFPPLGGVVRFYPIPQEICLASSWSEATLSFYSSYPPGTDRIHYNAVVIAFDDSKTRKTSEALASSLAFGNVTGVLPQVPGVTAQAEVVINEFLVVAPTGRESFYELRNQTVAPIPLTDWVLFTASGTIDSLSGTLPGWGYLADSSYTELPPDKPGQLGSDSVFGTSQGSGPPFAPRGDAIGLLDPLQNLVDGVLYGNFGGAPISCPLILEENVIPPFAGGGFPTSATANGDPDTLTTSTSRTPDGRDSGDYAQDFNVGQPTPGTDNSASGPALGSSVRLNSVYAGGTTQDGIQLFNPTQAPVDARAWYVSDGTVIDPILNGTGVDGTIGSESGRELRENEPSSFTFSLGFGDVLYLYNSSLVRLDQIGWHRIPAYFPDSCMVRVPTAVGPADGYDWSTSGGDITLFYLECPLMETTVGVGETTPRVSSLGRPVPNPARGAVALSFTLALGPGERERVRIGIYDVSGRRVRILGDGREWGPGTHTVHWDGRDGIGRRATAGVYFAKMVVSGRKVGESRSIVWLRP